MKKNYTEKYIKEMIEDRVFPKAPEIKELFSLDHLVAGSMLKRNGEENVADCALDINEQGILLVFIEDEQSDKEVVFHHFEFSEIQGIQVKKRMIFRHIILQFKDGRNYVFQCIKQNTNRLPYQKEHLDAFISILEAQNLHDMNNKVHRQNVKSNRKMAFVYISTLILFLAAAMFLTLNAFPNSMIAMIIITIGAGIIHFIVFILGFLLIYMKKDRPFAKEFNPIMKEYKESQDAEKLLTQLLAIKSEPKNQDSKNTFYLTLSTAFHENNQTEQALETLDKVQTTNEKEIEIVEEQRRVLGEGRE